MKRFLPAAAVAFGLLALASLAPVGATHVQTAPNGTLVQFDHDGDNEWWVEVLTKEGAGTQVVAVDTLVEGGGTFPMQHKAVVGGWDKWGPAQSFRVPPGARVAFDAHTIDASGEPGKVRSCWFTHPAGVEQCAPAPVTEPGWRSTRLGSAGDAGYGGDIALSDVDNDGRRDITLARDNGLRVYESGGTSWGMQLLSTRSFDAVAAGDGDGDGRREVYAVAPSPVGRDLVQYRLVDGAWDEEPLLGFAHGFGGDMTLGDIDGAAGPELYVSMTDMECDPDPNVPLCSTSSVVYLARKSGTGWDATEVGAVSGTIDSFWVGDADNNGRRELYIGHHTRHANRVTQLQLVMGSWQQTELPGTGSEWGWSQVVAGDGDRDGRQEVYAANGFGDLAKITYSQVDGWSSETIFSMFSPPTSPEGRELGWARMVLGDGDGDGSQELYLTSSNDGLYQARWSGSAWTLKRIAFPVEGGVQGFPDVLAAGDGDGDGRSEVFTAVDFFTEGQPGSSALYKVERTATSFDATFTAVKGNAYWVQANVAATGGTLAKVDVRLDGGAWKPLAKQDWGAWAASYAIPQGTVVQLRATSTAGATDLSDCYQWVPPSGQNAAKVACGSTPPPPPPTFDAAFTGVKGNAYWVQASVSGNQPIAKVEARVNCGATWVVLPKQDWGGYAKSFHVPDGSKVDFRATSSTGATDGSGGYIWPQATGTTPC